MFRTQQSPPTHSPSYFYPCSLLKVCCKERGMTLLNLSTAHPGRSLADLQQTEVHFPHCHLQNIDKNTKNMHF